MATWGDLKQFTYGELTEMGLTYGDLNALTIEQLIQIARTKLDRFNDSTEPVEIPSSAIELLNSINFKIEKIASSVETPKPKEFWIKERAVKLFDRLLELAAVWAITHPIELRQLLCDMLSALSKIIQN